MRLIQLTDIHLKSDPRGTIVDYSPDIGLQRVLRSIETDQLSADVFILTGDLADDASPSAYTRLQLMLAKLQKPVFVLPGNHDLPEAMRASLLGSSIHMEDISEYDDWMLLFLDSRIPGQDHGYVGKIDLSRAESFLSGNPHKYCMIALHHSAFSECCSTGCRLENAEDLLALSAKHENLKVVISGHTHWAVERVHGGTKFLSTPSTFLHVTHTTDPDLADVGRNHSYLNRGAYRVIDLFPDGSVHSRVCEVDIT
jgi:3',5'-cyclic-AMP phosphodiesterase